MQIINGGGVGVGRVEVGINLPFDCHVPCTKV